MEFVRYRDDREHAETCGFEEYKKDSGTMVACGKPAYGQAGKGAKATPLCKEHYLFARGARSSWEEVER